MHSILRDAGFALVRSRLDSLEALYSPGSERSESLDAEYMQGTNAHTVYDDPLLVADNRLLQRPSAHRTVTDPPSTLTTLCFLLGLRTEFARGAVQRGSAWIKGVEEGAGFRTRASGPRANCLVLIPNYQRAAQLLGAEYQLLKTAAFVQTLVLILVVPVLRCEEVNSTMRGFQTKKRPRFKVSLLVSKRGS